MKTVSPDPGQLLLELAGVPEVPAAPRRLRSVKAAPEPPRAPAPPPKPAPQRQPQRGDLVGAAPTSRQVRAITMRVEQLDDGRWRFTLPKVANVAWVASNAGQAIVAIRSAFTEAQVAAYSDWKNVLHDAEVPDYRRRQPRRSKPMKNRRDVHPPTKWIEVPDGRWRSPAGLLYPADCEVVMRVRRKLFRHGLALDPDAPPRALAERQAS